MILRLGRISILKLFKRWLGKWQSSPFSVHLGGWCMYLAVAAELQ